MFHENKLYILNNEHYWHKCLETSFLSHDKAIYRNRYRILNNHFICEYDKCGFKFPVILGPTTVSLAYSSFRAYYGTQVYDLGPPYTVFWEHLSQHKPGYIELDVSEFQNI